MATPGQPASSNGMAVDPPDFAQTFAQLFTPTGSAAGGGAAAAGGRGAAATAPPQAQAVANPYGVGYLPGYYYMNTPPGPLAACPPPMPGGWPGGYAWPGSWQGQPWPAFPPPPVGPAAIAASGAPAAAADALPAASGAPPPAADALPAAAADALPAAAAEDGAGVELEPLKIRGGLRVPYAHSMQADIDVVVGEGLVEPEMEAPAPPAQALGALPLRTHLEKMLAKTVERCAVIRPPGEPTWSLDIKEAAVGMGYRVSKTIGNQMHTATEEEIARFCQRHLNVSMDAPVYTIFGLQRQAAGSRYLKLTEEAEDALICRRGAEHERAINAQSRLMTFKDSKHTAQYVLKSKGQYVFSLKELGLDVHEVGPTRYRAIRARNRWFRAHQHTKLAQEHVVHTGIYPLMQGTRPISQISPL